MTYVTRASLQAMLDNASPEKQSQIVGRALLVLFRKQTEIEKSTNTTCINNAVGFTSADGHSGCIGAKTFIKNGYLRTWQVERWTRKGKGGYARIAKYHAQLNDAAARKEEGKTKVVTNILSGKLVRIPANTPRCCDPSSELYHSM